MHRDQSAELDWKDDFIPVSTRFADPYFSIHDGLEETRHVFLAGNDLPARFREGFHIAELGFGTGLNALAAWRSWRESGAAGSLRFTSFEAYPMSADQMARALRSFPALDEEADALVRAWARAPGQLFADGLELRVIFGDARAQLPRWPERADAWFLDGFSPARNPEMWGADLMRQVAAHTAPQGSFATYTAAGHVRRSLGDAGFAVQRSAGYGTKRHMSSGRIGMTR